MYPKPIYGIVSTEGPKESEVVLGETDNSASGEETAKYAVTRSQESIRSSAPLLAQTLFA